MKKRDTRLFSSEQLWDRRFVFFNSLIGARYLGDIGIGLFLLFFCCLLAIQLLDGIEDSPFLAS